MGLATLLIALQYWHGHMRCNNRQFSPGSDLFATRIQHLWGHNNGIGISYGKGREEGVHLAQATATVIIGVWQLGGHTHHCKVLHQSCTIENQKSAISSRLRL
uniref:Uncharacterized protein n=1 Tax=Eutreptiella gymnastica TaxID=73025 RepID=A0A6T2GBZ1_9EUGL